ncbi:probable tubulin polyglutamylase TTLL2 [Pungitius pungitius]|uniref:probable tubulin polyglutamylase TTLL2 n=1 Tax=Pungitius pungitius TaxID=134920 RepID=UPI002E0D80AF
MAACLVFRLHDRGPQVVREVLLERGWEEYDQDQREEEDWNLYWRGSAFCVSEYNNLFPWQRLNHHPKTVGITRKDCLARNLKRMRATFGSALYDFSPAAFILPNDYTRFLSQYSRRHGTRGPSVYWICKPVDLSRGRGIFILEDIKDLAYDRPVIVQRYISEPLLISGYKFDLRIYACVRSFHPLTVYIHQEGLVRFATEKYDLSSPRNLYAHLTNTSINKFGPSYGAAKERVGHGCKWTMSKFRHFLHIQDVNELLLWQRINNIVTLTLLAIAPSVPSCPNCVELFGFDILIDGTLKPWLLEVNYSPALTLDCQADVAAKRGVIGDLIDLMNYASGDGLRGKARRRPLCVRARRPWRLPKPPELSGFKGTGLRKQRSGGQSSQELPVMKAPRQPEKMNPRQSGQYVSVADYRRLLPPVESTQTHATRDGPANRTHRDTTRNLTFGPCSRTNASVGKRRPRPALAHKRGPRVSEVTNPDRTETEAATGRSGEAGASSSIRDTSHGGPGSRRSKLPDIYSGNRGPLQTARTPALKEHSPPLRVGDFIRTFPFNAATLRASQPELDVKVVLRELLKLPAQVATPGHRLRREGEDGEEVKEAGRDEDFDALLWGPKDPPLLSRCFKRL